MTTSDENHPIALSGSIFNDTFLGLVFHKHLKHFSQFQFPEEHTDFQPPQQYLPGYKTSIYRSNNANDDKKMVEGATGSNVEQGVSPIVPSPFESRDGSASEELECPPSSMDADDPYIVDWYGPSDPANPQMWSSAKKGSFLIMLMILTTSVYMGSSIVAPAIPILAEYFNVGLTPAALALSLFVFGYGISPMLGLTSMSEIPAIGRAIPYVISLLIFVILQIPTALVKNIAGFMILRFLAGLFGSPPLATGGASVQDIWTPMTAPLAMGLWGISASAGPVLGPLVGAFATEGFLKTSLGTGAWRWTIWPLLFVTAFTLIVLVLFMPETSASNILARRAERLRKVTGNPHLRSRGELFAETMTGYEIAMMTFVRPFRLGLFEPIALAINLHIGLVYGILYSFFESFPIVFNETYGFTLGESGLAYLGILISNLLAYTLFAVWFLKYYRPKYIKRKGRLPPEEWLQPAMLGGILLPISLFVFGWTANAKIHWIVPIIGTMLFSPAIFGLFTSGLNHLTISYADYVASVLSANDFMRASIGAALPLVSRQLFNNLNRGPKEFPVAWGCTLLGCIALLMAPIPFALAYWGPTLRKASPYARDPMIVDEKDQGQHHESKNISDEKEMV